MGAPKSARPPLCLIHQAAAEMLSHYNHLSFTCKKKKWQCFPRTSSIVVISIFVYLYISDITTWTYLSEVVNNINQTHTKIFPKPKSSPQAPHLSVPSTQVNFKNTSLSFYLLSKKIKTPPAIIYHKRVYSSWGRACSQKWPNHETI